MSAEKVRRYSAEEMVELATRLDDATPLFCEATGVAQMLRQASQTEADVAGLVEALRNLLSVDDITDAFDILAARYDARNELARWQS